MSVAISKGIYWDMQNMQLVYQGKHLCKIQTYQGHFLLEHNDNHNSVLQEHTALPASIRKSSAEKWHQILAHANSDVIHHLEANTEGVSVTNEPPVPKTIKCQPCALSKSQRIISRESTKEEDSNEPFYRVSFDLLQLQKAYNQDKWTSHFACTKTEFTFIFTHPNKSDAQDIIEFFVQMVKTRYKRSIAFLRTDGERTIGNETKAFLQNQGITLETSAPNTPEQNGHAERSGGIIIAKARAMRIGANLPESLWPEIIRTAGYIHNRTPIAKLNWKTPFEAATGKKPNLVHLRIYGCRAYALKKGIPRSQKLTERAHLGHLVGYDSTNIFRIWIPSQQKVIRTRDVKFNEDEFYKPDDPDLTQLLQEEASEIIQTLEIQAPAQLSETIAESDDEDLGISNGTESIQDAENELNEGQSGQQHALPTPEPSIATSQRPRETPELDPEQEPRITGSTLPPLLPAQYDTPPQPGAAPGNRAPRGAEISGTINQDTILPEGVGSSSRSTRNPNPTYQSDPFKKPRKPRKEAYSTALSETQENANSSFFNAFSAALSTPRSPPRIHRDELPPEPKTFKEMLQHTHSSGFIPALKTEVRNLVKIGTWRFVKRYIATQAGKKVIPLTWVFKYKFDTEGYLIKYKARLCVRGDLQLTEQDTYAATLAAQTFRGITAIMAAFDLESRQYDMINAFVNSPIDEDTYCELPEGLNLLEEYQDLQPGLILQLLRALYGLKQSPALWNNHFSATLQDLGLAPVPGVNCLFSNDSMILFFFVDDIAVIFPKESTREVDEFQQKLADIYEMRILGELEWFLNIRIIRDRPQRKLWLCQDSYIEKLATKFNINPDKKPSTPLPVEELQSSDTQVTAQETYAYQQKIGSINFAAVTTRPDIAQATSKLAEYLQNPSQRHQQLATRVIEYLVTTKHLAIEFNGICNPQQNVFLACSDASFANDQETRKSSQGYVFQLFGGPIDWKANKQRTVTTSSTEAEFLSLSTTAKQLLWWERLFRHIQFDPDHHLFIQCDNRQTIRLLDESSPKLTTKLRHVDIHQHWLRQEIQSKRIMLQWTPSAEMVADGLTKALPPQRFQQFVKQLNLSDIKHLVTQQT
jgi:hypothetical protein